MRSHFSVSLIFEVKGKFVSRRIDVQGEIAGGVANPSLVAFANVSDINFSPWAVELEVWTNFILAVPVEVSNWLKMASKTKRLRKTRRLPMNMFHAYDIVCRRSNMRCECRCSDHMFSAELCL
jgi:hypothetical protein